MRRAFLGVVCLTLAGVCAMPQPAASQETEKGPLLWISYVTAEPGKSNELTMHLATEGAKSYDDLVADGHVLSWGVAQAVNHFPGDDWTHLEFINFRDWSAVNEFINRFMGRMQSMSEEDQMAGAARWDELTVHGSHYDVIGRHQYLLTNGTPPAFISLSTFKTQPGVSEDQIAEIYRTWRAPVLDPLVESGTITGHGVYTPYMHGPGGWDDVTGWVTMTDLGGMDAVEAAAEAADAARSEEEQAEWMERMQALFQAPAEGTHTDRLLVVTHFNMAEAPADQ